MEAPFTSEAFAASLFKWKTHWAPFRCPSHSLSAIHTVGSSSAKMGCLERERNPCIHWSGTRSEINSRTTPQGLIRISLKEPVFHVLAFAGSVGEDQPGLKACCNSPSKRCGNHPFPQDSNSAKFGSCRGFVFPTCRSHPTQTPGSLLGNESTFSC